MPNEFETEIEAIEQKLDAIVDVGSDDELFIASYLRGHFDLVACKLLAEANTSMTTLNDNVQQSLAGAFANGELERDDQHKVKLLWGNLIRN